MGSREKNLKEILILLRDFSQLMVNLGYAALMEDDFELAQEAIRVRNEIRELSFDLRKEALMVARLSRYDKEDIPEIANILQIGVAIKEMSDGIDDLIEIVVREAGIHPIIQMAYGRKDYRMMRYEVEEKSKLDGTKLEKVEIDAKTGFVINAIRRGEEWILYPHGKTKIEKGDILIVEGRDVSIRKMQSYVKGKKEKKKAKK